MTAALETLLFLFLRSPLSETLASAEQAAFECHPQNSQENDD